MDKQFILDEIRRTAAENGGQPLGQARFARVTGISISHWAGRYWARWNDAISEAGLPRNSLQAPFAIESLVESFALAVRKYGRIPTTRELQLLKRDDPGFPSRNCFQRLGRTKRDKAARMLTETENRDEFGDVAAICQQFLEQSEPETASESLGANGTDSTKHGFVYLFRIGQGTNYKIGFAENVGRRLAEVQSQHPEPVELIHNIRTDDPAGIEKYWHLRFADKRIRREFFKLTQQDVKDFKRRSFQ